MNKISKSYIKATLPHLPHPSPGPVQPPALGREVSVLLVSLREGCECALPSKSACLPCSAM